MLVKTTIGWTIGGLNTLKTSKVHLCSLKWKGIFESSQKLKITISFDVGWVNCHIILVPYKCLYSSPSNNRPNDFPLINTFSQIIALPGQNVDEDNS